MTSKMVYIFVFYLFVNEVSINRRFTASLAQKARSVVAMDFIDSFVEKNWEANRHLGNIRFIQADVTQFNQPDDRYGRIVQDLYN